MSTSQFHHSKIRMVIGSLDDTSLEVEAQYNPAEVTVKKDIPWTENKRLGAVEASDVKEAARSQGNNNSLEYTGAKGREMSFELFFDGYEEKRTITPQIRKLERLCSPVNPDEPDETKRRAHQCVVAWGHGEDRRFVCVITAFCVKYTMFSRDGLPLRATCSITLREAYLGDSVKTAQDTLEMQYRNYQSMYYGDSPLGGAASFGDAARLSILQRAIAYGRAAARRRF